MTELKGVARGLGIDQKILQQLAAGSSLEVNPSSAVTLASESVCMCACVHLCEETKSFNLLNLST